MSGGEIAYRVFEIINYVVIILTTIGFGFQLVMILFFWLKEKKFKEAKTLHKIAVLFPAHNEESVIYGSVRDIFENQDYPKELFEVFVVAHNCEDKTAELAEKAGAHVIVYNDPDPKTHTLGNAQRRGIQEILKDESFEIVIKLDADNRLSSNYLRAMNNAYESGVLIARGFEAPLNGTQNTWTAVSAAYYIRDSRIACNFRERAHLDSMLCGPGMTIATSVLRKIPGGFDALSISEDVEFTINRLSENYRIHYVGEAIVYEDQPSTMKDTYARLSRMGHGLHNLFWKKGFKLFGHFFKSGRWSNIDLFVQLMFIPIDVLCITWFPLYYIAYAIIHIMNAFGATAGFLGFMTALESYSAIWSLLLMAVGVILSFLIIYSLQTYAAVALSRKKIGMDTFKGMKRGIFLSAPFMLFYGVSVLFGILFRAKWKNVHRNAVPESFSGKANDEKKE